MRAVAVCRQDSPRQRLATHTNGRGVYPDMHVLYQDYREKGFEILAISMCSVGHETNA